MKISLSWLKTLITTDHSVEELSTLLTSAGLEVEGVEQVESIPGGLKGLLVGEVLECAKHPDADRLSVTRVDTGSGTPANIVCGAPNVAAGQKVIVAMPGAKLFPSDGAPIEIKKSKIRGVPSEGMICAEDEIGIGKSHAGIMVLPADTPVGMPASEFFKCETDTVLEIGLTPNRNDAASHLGIARDLAAVLNSAGNDLHYKPEISGMHELPKAGGSKKVKIEIIDKQGCGRYSGIVISDIRVRESPVWLKNRLKSIGQRPVNNIVDITNFVLHELGQPLHAFDLGKINGDQIIVRTARVGEKIRTLDEVERELRETDLVICNEAVPMCIAGVSGGAESGVTENTKAIFLESAWFDPAYIRSTARYHGLKTDASFRFERGTDPEMTVNALIRAANLIFEIAGGTLSMGVTDLYPEKAEPYKVAFSYRNCNELIGKEIERPVIKNIIQNLGMEIESEGSDGMLLKVPRYRHDVTREADVIEEVMRIYGYNNIEASRHISWTAFNAPTGYRGETENKMAGLLEGAGFSEIMSLSLSRETYYGEGKGAVRLVNPLSNDLNVLRADMIYSGLETIAYNINRKNHALKIFEFGKTYHQQEEGSEKYVEKKHLAIFVTGSLFIDNPYGLQGNADFAYLKSAVEAIFEKTGIRGYKSVQSEYPGFEYGLTLLLNKKVIAEMGAITKHRLDNFDIRQAVYYAVIDTERIVNVVAEKKMSFEEISKFPAVRRDLALMVDKSVKYGQIEELAFVSEKKFLKEVNLFDIYENEKIGDKRSYAVRFTLLNNEATLTDKQIDGVMDKLIRNFREKLGAELR